MKLWIDDERNPSDKHWKEFYGIPNDVIWCKTYTAALPYIQNETIEWVGFDNDLEDLQDRQGKHLFAILEERYWTNQHPFFKAVFQTSNTDAKRQMQMGYRKIENHNWENS